MVNNFILDEDRDASARSLCDQHANKIPMEIVQSAEVVQKMLNAETPLPKAHLHPLERWIALCLGNYIEVLLWGEAIMREYQHRFGKRHSHADRLDGLMCNVPNFDTPRWFTWFLREHKGKNSERESYASWFDQYGYYVSSDGDGEKEYVWEQPIRNEGACTHFPQIMNKRNYPGCRTPENAVAAYRAYYIMKFGGTVNGIKGKAPMGELPRYFYRSPPDWLVATGVAIQYTPKPRAPRKKRNPTINEGEEPKIVKRKRTSEFF